MSILRPKFLLDFTRQLDKIRLKDVNGTLHEAMLRVKNEYAIAKEKLKDIPGTNYALGLYHLQHGNSFDAIFRFRMVTWLNPKHAQAYYYLAQSYVLADKLPAAKKALESALSLQPNWPNAEFLLKKLTAPDSITSVPSSVIVEQRLQLLNNAVGSSASNRVKMRARHIVKKILSQISDTNPQLDILELGATNSLYAMAFQARRFSRHIDAITDSHAIASTLSLLEVNHVPVYRRVTEGLVLETVNETPPPAPYHLIIADHALGYCGTLEAFFARLRSYLVTDGIVAFILPVQAPDAQTPLVFDIKTNHFIYSKEAVISALTKSHYRVIDALSMATLLENPASSAGNSSAAPKASPVTALKSQKSSTSEENEYFFLCKKAD